ncbi:MAG: hypothetical protein ABUT20_62140 [Bacteroidota bacterium]
MPGEPENKLTVLLKRLADKKVQYDQASLRGAGFNERRELRTQLREIENEIQIWKDAKPLL